jgi:hypothetical protein
MQCKLVLCEGKYDRCLIEELLSGEIYYANEMKKFLELIRSFCESENTVLILSCGGKEGLYKKVGDLVAKLRGSSFNAILMLDQDGGDTFSKVKRRIEEFINTPCKFHPQKPILEEKKNATLALSLKNCFSNIFIAEVPESLESVVAKKLREKFGLSTSGPHGLISLVVERQLLKEVENECDVFKLAASDGWFSSEGWFHRLSELLSK